MGRKPDHYGIDIRLDQKPPLVFAAAAGKTVIIKHPDDFFTLYAGLGKILTACDRKVCKNQAIAVAGSGKQSVFHFEIRHNSLPCNPLSYIN